MASSRMHRTGFHSSTPGSSLPGEVVFDGVVQAFFTRASYYSVMAAVALDAYSAPETTRLLAEHAHPGIHAVVERHLDELDNRHAVENKENLGRAARRPVGCPRSYDVRKVTCGHGGREQGIIDTLVRGCQRSVPSPMRLAPTCGRVGANEGRERASAEARSRQPRCDTRRQAAPTARRPAERRTARQAARRVENRPAAQTWRRGGAVRRRGR